MIKSYYIGFMKKVLDYIHKAHEGQTRDLYNLHYTVHPISVYKILFAIGIKHNMLTAALLHDVVEDTDVTIQDIEKTFGSEVAILVAELTSDETQYIVKGRTDHGLKAQYLINKMNNMLIQSLIIKLADRLDNLIDIYTSGKKKWIMKYFIQTEVIMNGLNIKYENDWEKQKWKIHVDRLIEKINIVLGKR